MNRKDVHDLVEKGLFPGPTESASLIETHISWIILTKQYAFKIKKPVVFDFLDFSTIELRKYYCEEECRLNKRLTSDMYLQVLPVGKNGIGDEGSYPVDYAVQMRRMENTREMHLLLNAHHVNTGDMEALARLLVPFHQQHRLPPHFAYSVEESVRDFGDLFHVEDALSTYHLPNFHRFEAWKEEVPAFLRQHSGRFQERIAAGWWVEGHGDLHSRNIFLPPQQPPVIFDCIEFNRHFRCMDVLDELAFLCMDLEMHKRADLARAFLNSYKSLWNCFEVPEDTCIFNYFKAYRANVRLKVAILSQQQHLGAKQAHLIHQYWDLLSGYMNVLWQTAEAENDNPV